MSFSFLCIYENATEMEMVKVLVVGDVRNVLM